MKKNLEKYERLTVHIPREDARRCKAVLRALGIEIEKKNALDLAMDDIVAGRVHSYGSVDELINHFRNVRN